MVSSIVHASTIIATYGNNLESQWAVYDSKISYNKIVADRPQGLGNEEDLKRDQAQDMSEYDNDRESLDPAEMKKSSIYQFFWKLERYYVACQVVTSELVHLVRPGNAEHNVIINVTVKTVPILMTTSTPAEQNEHQQNR